MMKSKWGSLSEASFLATITIIFLWVNACFAGNEWVDYQGTGFNLRIPGDVKVEKTTPVEDFDIFRFFDVSGKQILGIYAGNHPQFPVGVPEGVEQKKSTLGGKSLEKAEWGNSGGYYGQLLVHLQTDAPGYPPFPVFVHLWYLELNAVELAAVKKILDSFQPDKP